MKILPFFAMVGMDFVNTDCFLTNPLLSGIEGCPCYTIKHPVEIISNNSDLPSDLLESGPLEVFVLRNYTLLDSDFSLDTLVDFPLSHNGMWPLICQDMTGTDTDLHSSNNIYNRRKLAKALKSAKPWTLTWLVIIVMFNVCLA